jgi:hypothetical protein
MTLAKNAKIAKEIHQFLIFPGVLGDLGE